MAETKKRVSRRRVLLAAGAVVVAAVPLGSFYAYQRKPSVAKVIRERLWYLTFSDEVLNAFLRDHFAAVQDEAQRMKQVQVVFLMSTDFFQNGENEAKPLRYLAYSDPYLTPCSNPFAQPA